MKAVTGLEISIARISLCPHMRSRTRTPVCRLGTVGRACACSNLKVGRLWPGTGS